MNDATTDPGGGGTPVDGATGVAVRRRVLHNLAQLDRTLDRVGVDLAHAEAADDDADAANLLRIERTSLGHRSATLAAYRDLIPTIPISRCPFTGEVVEWPLDLTGIDGPFWDARHPVRPLPPRPPDTLLAVTGAIALRGAIEPTPHLVKPGPGRPYVIPRMLADGRVVAVLSATMVGAHPAFVTTYFAPDGVGPRANEWGTDRFPVWRPAGTAGRDQVSTVGWDRIDGDEEVDADLLPWLEAGQLRWIDAGDHALRLRDEVDGCPYLAIDGASGWQRVQRGEVWVGGGARPAAEG